MGSRTTDSPKWQYKAVLSGPILELSYTPTGRGFDVDDMAEGGDGRRVSNIVVAHRRLRRIINCNAGQWWDRKLARWYHPLFLTLTFAENLRDVATANEHYMRFVKRVNYNLLHTKKAALKYSVVIEFQKRGAVHYHVLLYNMPFYPCLSDILADIWGFGFIRMNAIDSIDNIGAYVTKYMTKGGLEELDRGKKSYFNARGLYHPLETDDLVTIMDYQSLINEKMLMVDSQYEDGSLYQRYNVKSTILRYLNSGYPMPPNSLSTASPDRGRQYKGITPMLAPAWFS